MSLARWSLLTAGFSAGMFTALSSHLAELSPLMHVAPCVAVAGAVAALMECLLAQAQTR